MHVIQSHYLSGVPFSYRPLINPTPTLIMKAWCAENNVAVQPMIYNGGVDYYEDGKYDDVDKAKFSACTVLSFQHESALEDAVGSHVHTDSSVCVIQ
jgi:hypothetical protein